MGTKRKITGDIFDLGIQLDHPTEQAGRVLLYTLADKLYQRFPNGDIKAVGSGEGEGGGIGWATTGKLDDFDAAASTAGVVVTGDDTKATMSATEAGQVFAFKAVDIPMVLDQNYFRGLSLATAAFDAKIQCFGTEWVDVGGLVEPINTSEVALFLLSFSKKEYTKARVVFTSLAAGTLTLSRGEWTDRFSRIAVIDQRYEAIPTSFTNVGTLPATNANSTSQIIGDSVYIFGGRTGAATYVNTIYKSTHSYLSTKVETGLIAMSTSEAHKFALRASATESEAGWSDTRGKKIYKRTIVFNSDNVPTPNNLGTAITPINSHNYYEHRWTIVHTAASPAYAVLYYDKATGAIKTTVASYKFGVGTEVDVFYTKD